MKIQIKIASLMLVLIVAMLFGGNVFADDSSLQGASFAQVSAQIDQVRQKIDQLTGELEAKQTAPIEMSFASTALTSEQLNYIKSEIDRIAMETERLKVEVAVFVALREIKQKVAQITAQVAAISPLISKSLVAPLPSTTMLPAPVAMTGQANEDVEAQIAKIKQQINELTQEMKQKIEAEKFVSAAKDSNDEDEIIADDENEAREITILPVDKKSENDDVEKKSFWASLGDFLKKIFTF